MPYRVKQEGRNPVVAEVAEGSDLASRTGQLSGDHYAAVTVLQSVCANLWCFHVPLFSMKWLMILLGLLALLLGAVTFWLPIPIGVPLLLLGLFLLLKYSVLARRTMARSVRNSAWVKRAYRKVQSLKRSAKKKSPGAC